MPGIEYSHMVKRGANMEKGENLNRRNLPTLQQLRYLTELEKEDNTRGMIARIAEKCQVSTAPVSRYLKSCCEKGLLTEDYRVLSILS